MAVKLLKGDCLLVLAAQPANSVDAIITDPPYGLSFMNKHWDYSLPGVEIWKECLRVLKPGGHLLSFAGTRTQHRMAVNIEDAGFEIRDLIAWVYGSGFPKSKNLDGAWQGWGTALKPALEPITVARKPIAEKTVAANVLAYGTGAINIDASRVPPTGDSDAAAFESNHRVTERLPENRNGQNLGLHDGGWKQRVGEAVIPPGRWPANLIHDGSDEVTSLFPHTVAGKPSDKPRGKRPGGFANVGAESGDSASNGPQYGDMGNASRFFYCPKASSKDRHAGVDNPGAQFKQGNTLRKTENTDTKGNNHPTVKPTALMRYLCNLVTPHGGVILDPFMGSGSTGRAAVLDGFKFIGIEREPDYFAIAELRVNAAMMEDLL